MEFNDTFFDRLGKSAEVTNLCVDVAEKIAAEARATAPADTEDYRDSIKVITKTVEHRNVALVVATDWKAIIIESKTGNLVRALNKVKKNG
ncbi:HK97 gp10 family phage protein [Paeniglutamicibacter sp. R2-26]|uniref:HK97 gp10 family phage protein n=1 Tax=Paeniglutamicibacter sp. R2-26 TaxID=3144417 RepID=UPI003EE47602